MRIFCENAWYKKRKSYRVLFWREIAPLAIPLFIEGLCVLLMGVFSTLLVSWLGKEAMAAVGLADSFNMLIAAFFTSVALGTSVVVSFSLGQRKCKQAQTAARESISLLVLISLLLVLLVHFAGEVIINLMASQADPEVKTMALSYLRLTAWNYPAMAITLVGCGALRGAGNTRLPMFINISMNILNIAVSSVLIYGVGNWQGMGFIGAGIGISVTRYLGALVVVLVLRLGCCHQG